MRVGKASCGVWSCRISGRPTVIVGRSRLFFGNVNQVLVRLWARVIAATPSECLWSRRSADLSDREWLFVVVNGSIRAACGAPTVDDEGSEAR
jgi:hypothetical protein